MWYLIVSVPDHCLSFYFTKTVNYLLSMCDKLPQEKLHSKFCKYILGVSSRATNLRSGVK